LATSDRPIEAPENNLLAGWKDKHRAIILSVLRVPGANVIETVDNIRGCCRSLKLPFRRQSRCPLRRPHDDIRASVADVRFTLILTIALVVMVIFIFLRNFWATVIPAITVPLSRSVPLPCSTNSATASITCL